MQIEEVFLTHPFGQLLSSVAGIGLRTGSRIRAEIGDGTRFADGDKLASYAGLAPVTRQSGKSINGESKSRRGDHRLKDAMFLAAFASLRAPESKAFYDRKLYSSHRSAAEAAVLHGRLSGTLAALGAILLAPTGGHSRGDLAAGPGSSLEVLIVLAERHR